MGRPGICRMLLYIIKGKINQENVTFYVFFYLCFLNHAHNLFIFLIPCKNTGKFVYVKKLNTIVIITHLHTCWYFKSKLNFYLVYAFWRSSGVKHIIKDSEVFNATVDKITFHFNVMQEMLRPWKKSLDQSCRCIDRC